MKPQLGKSQLAVFRHAPSVRRKYRPSGSMGSHTYPSSNLSAASSTPATPGRGGIGVSRTGAPGFKPPSLLRRQSTRHKSFMELDLPSMRALRREPSLMELDPPSTLFAPAPTPANFLPGPWAFFQAAEAQREQRQAQVEFLAKLQELRLRDEQLFVNVMSGFAREYPVQFSQLTGFMKQMELELELGLHDQNQQQQQYYHQQQQQQRQLQYQQQLYQQDPLGWLKSMMTSTGSSLGRNGATGRGDHRGTKSGVLALAQAFGNQIYGSPGIPPPQQLFLQQQLEQQQQFMRQAGYSNNFNNGHNGGAGGRGRGRERGGKGGRGGRGQGNHNNANGGFPSRQLPNLKRGKSFQQQQQALQQVSAYQRQLYQQVQQMQSNHGTSHSTGAVPMAHELMQYAAMAAMAGRSGKQITPQLGPSSPNSSQGSLSPLSPPGFGATFGYPNGSTPNEAQLELAAFNMHLNQGSSRRSRYKPPPPPLRIH